MTASMTPVQTVQSLYGAFGSGDLPALLALLQPDIRWQFIGDRDAPYTGTVQGHEAVAKWLGEVARIDAIQAFEPREFLGGSDHVTVIGWERTADTATGRVFESDWIHVFQLRDGKIARFLGMLDSEAAAAARD